MRLKTRNQVSGFTLVEVLVVMTVIVVVLTLGFNALKKALPGQRLNTGSHIILSDFRNGQMRAAQDGVTYVLEIIGDYTHAPGGTVLRMGNVYRLWQEEDFNKYIGLNSDCSHPAIHQAGFPAPFLVYDLLDSSSTPPGLKLSNDLNDRCGDSDLSTFSDDEIPLPIFESVPVDYKDDPTVAAQPNFRFIRRLGKFNRRYVIPEGIKIAVPFRQPTSSGCLSAGPVWWAIYFVPGGGAQARLLAARPSGNMSKPCTDAALGAGIFHVGLILEKRVALGDNFKSSTALITQYCTAESNARGIEITLASSSLRLVASQPQRYALPSSQCDLDLNNWR